MKANITSYDITGKSTYYVVTVEVTDGDAVHELDVVVVGNYDGTSGTTEYSVEDGSTEWITEVIDDDEKRDKIVSMSKEAAKEYSEASQIDTVDSLDEFLHACAYWNENDILEEADSLGMAMNKEEAKVFLKKHEREIKDAMIKAGWHEIRNGLSTIIP